MKDRFQAFLNGETQIVADEAFINAVQSYYEVSFIYINNITLPMDLKLLIYVLSHYIYKSL